MMKLLKNVSQVMLKSEKDMTSEDFGRLVALLRTVKSETREMFQEKTTEKAVNVIRKR